MPFWVRQSWCRHPRSPSSRPGRRTSSARKRASRFGTIGIYDFEARDDQGVYLQDQQRRWYYARISGVCTGLPFANRIAVDTRFGGSELDRTGTLLVDGQSCHIDSLTASNGPPPKPKKVKKG
ncbi:hypothetical protein FPZ24_00855 [Sphingomonas panacisoli]|uniref:Uncharacterized protein n=1 Tax=Sphingomonas panacisoli TaxID=1813879 RepID=A0A5B8LE60_9SPHN|nr:DUF6491 family protein [Sphingomonas panacisoli]QDZ06199.1 hypothetical protein FPZ24_00855 [Sphingomonas panacisoli]